MPQITWLFVCLFQVVVLVKSDGYYSIVAPGTIRSNSFYHVSLTTYNTNEPSVIKVGITGPSFNETKEVEIPPNSNKLIDFKLPVLENGNYNLTAQGISGIKFENQTDLKYVSKDRSIFIQTDKATYKPGDIVRFRVLVLDPNTRPVKFDDPVNIKITDSGDNIIKQFKNVKLEKGVYSGEIQLSEFPVLGDWTLEVSSGNVQEVKKFEIAKYVLPKFEVKVEAPKHTLSDGKLRVTVRGKYTYGKPIKGDATVTIQENIYWRPKDVKTISKTVPLNGKAYLEFDMSELETKSYLNEILISATVEEKLTGNKMNATTTTRVHKEKYEIVPVDVPYSYEPNKPFKVVIAVKNYDGTPVQDTKNPVKFVLKKSAHGYFGRQVSFESENENNKTEVKQELEAKKQIVEKNIDDNGMVTVEFTIMEEENESNRYSHYTLMAYYLGIESYITGVAKRQEEINNFEEDLKLKVLNKKPTLEDEISVEVLSKEPINYFVYEIVGRGDILESGIVNLEKKSTKNEFKFKPKFEMIPKANIFVHLIRDGNITSASETVDFENNLENFIKINLPEKSKPGEEVDISINTNPDSYVGLLGVDQSVLLLKSGNDLTKDAIFGEIGQYQSYTPFNFYFDSNIGSSAGLVVLSNGHYAFNGYYPFYMNFASPQAAFGGVALLSGVEDRVEYDSKAVIENVRKEFPETWMFDSHQTLNEQGELKLHKKVPDTITSWVVTGFSVNSKTGLGLTEEPVKLNVFQPFFVSTNLPYSVKRGEVINVPVAVFNYLDKNLDADVTLDNSEKEFEFAEATNDVEEMLSEDAKRLKRTAVAANSGESVSFLIRPKKVGQITLKLSAITPISGDAIEQILLVEPEGVTQFKNKAIFIDLSKESEFKQDLDIDLPENVVPDSVYSEISVVGDLLGPIIKNLDKLVRMPYGCGEQNMVNFVPNILVLKYLESLNKLSPTIEEKAKKFLEIGYQRELTYKHPDGSYSAFGTSDKNGSTWLTAYVARSFRQATKFTQIDEKVIEAALKFLSNAQNENGSFTENGHVIDLKYTEDKEKIFLTAFTLLAFLENKEAFPEYNETIKKGLDYLAKNINEETKEYSLSIATYVLNLADHPERKNALGKLKRRANENGDRKYWSEKVEKKPDFYWWEPPTNDIETTSYALLSLLESNETNDEILPVLRWLISKRNSLGGYYSTQATVIGLEAFIKFSQKYGSVEKGDIIINFTDDQNTKGQIIINDENSLLLQTYLLPSNARRVSFSVTGKGATLAQLSYRYNIENQPEDPRFKLNVNVEDVKSAEVLKLKSCTSFIPKDNENQSNMAVMEVSLPSGYIADQDNIENIKKVEKVKKVETKNAESVVIIYFDGLDKDSVCVPINGIRTHKIGKQKPASVIVYDYYDNTRQARAFYLPPKSSLCDICDGADCGNGCSTSSTKS